MAIVGCSTLIRVEFDPDFLRFGGPICVSDETCVSPLLQQLSFPWQEFASV